MDDKSFAKYRARIIEGGLEPEEVEVLTRWHLEKAMQAEEKGDEAEAYWHRQRVNDLEAAYGKVSM
jgi:hypothetical protein